MRERRYGGNKTWASSDLVLYLILAITLWIFPISLLKRCGFAHHYLLYFSYLVSVDFYTQLILY